MKRIILLPVLCIASLTHSPTTSAMKRVQEPTVTLALSDKNGQSVEVTHTIQLLNHSLTLKNMIEDLQGDNNTALPVHNVSAEIFEKVIECLNIINAFGDTQEGMESLETITTELSASDLTELLQAASYLDITLLAEVTTKIFAQKYQNGNAEIKKLAENIAGDGLYAVKRKLIEDSQNLLFKYLEPSWTIKNAFACHDIEGSFSPDGKTVVIGFKGFKNSCIKIFDLENKAYSEIPLNHMDCLCISPDGALLAYSNGTSVTLFDLKTKLPIIDNLYQAADLVSSLCFSPNGKLLAAGTDFGAITIINLENPENTIHLQDDEEVYSMSFNHDATQLGVGYSEGFIKVFDLKTQDCINVLEGHNDVVHNLQFNKDSTVLASGSYDQTFRLWELQSSSVKSYKHKDLHIGNPKPIRICFDKENQQTAYSFASRTIRFFDLKSNCFTGCLEFDNQTDYILSDGTTGVTCTQKFDTIKFYQLTQAESLKNDLMMLNFKQIDFINLVCQNAKSNKKLDLTDLNDDTLEKIGVYMSLPDALQNIVKDLIVSPE